MPATLRSEIEVLAGTLSAEESSAIQQALGSACYELATVLPFTYMAPFCTSGSVTKIGKDIHARLLLITRDGWPAREVPWSLGYSHAVVGSIYEATIGDPVWYRDPDGAITIAPGSGTVAYYAYRLSNDEVDIDESSLADNVPVDWRSFLVYRGAIVKVESDIRQLLATSTLTTPSVVPAVPTLVYSITAPRTFTFSAPSLSGINLGSLDLTTGLTAPSWNTVTGPAASVLDQPSFTPLSISAQLDTLKFPADPAALVPGSGTASSATAGTIGSLGTPPSFTTITPNLENYGTGNEDLTDLMDARIADEDPEVAMAAIARVQAHLTEYQRQIEDNMGELNAEIEAYRGTVQAAIEQARLDTQAAMETARLATDVSSKNAALTTQHTLEKYSLQLNRWQAEVSRFQAEVNKEVTTYVTNNIQVTLAAWSRQAINYLSAYETDVQNERARFMSELEKFQAQINQKIQDYDIEAKNTLQEYAIDASRYGAEVEAAVQNWQDDFATYKAEFEETSTFNQQKMALHAQELQAYALDIQNNLNAFNTALQDRESRFSKLLGMVERFEQRAAVLKNEILAGASTIAQRHWGNPGVLTMSK